MDLVADVVEVWDNGHGGGVVVAVVGRVDVVVVVSPVYVVY
jgi:hypothetical protein